MTGKIFFSTSEYAQKKGISKMQVTRLIRSGKIPAERIGNNWLIYADPTDSHQVSLTKSTSLQVWAKAIQSQLGITIDVDRHKDRELIYAKMHSLGLPHERSFSFAIGHFPQKSEFKLAIERLSLPYWISAVPDPQFPYLDRQTKLRLYDLHSGWQFINSLNQKLKFKIILTQYPEDADFKGTILASRQGLGIAEFITGDRHYIMTRGFTLTDPLLFDKNRIVRYSPTIPRAKQEEIYSLIHGISGHFELQSGDLGGVRSISFFDYNDENAYSNIDATWKNLRLYLSHPHKSSPSLLTGLPSTPGLAFGRCLLVHHENIDLFQKISRGDILVSDTLTPEMVPFFKDISAIVTDLGGVTSHPAIICRELKIPTIVGTINATELLHTGQKIKVNASKGIISPVY